MKEWMGKIRTLSLFSLMVLVLSACGKDNLTALMPKGHGAEESFKVIIISTLVMIVVFLIVMIIYVYVIMKFRQKKGEENKIPKQVEGNKTLEIVWTTIPILLLLIIAVPTIAVTYDLADESKKRG